MRLRLHHGTSAAAAGEIERVGLLPRGERPGNWTSPGKVKSIPDMVYLADKPLQAEWFALRAAVVSGDTHTANVHVEVTDDSPLYPDENYYTSRKGAIFTEEFLAMQARVRDNRDDWKQSLGTWGLVCHRGVVAPSSIASIDVRPIEESPWYFMVRRERTVLALDYSVEVMTACGAIGHHVREEHIRDYDLEDRGDHIIFKRPDGDIWCDVSKLKEIREAA